jgi:hypothetical protein
LTKLQGDFVLKPGMLQHISNCTALQSLSMQTVGFLVQPSSSDWQVLGELTRLTKLQVARCMVRDQDPRPFYLALAHLTNLQAITAGLWTWGAAPTLAALTKVTSVCGEWAAEDQAWDGDGVCEQVVQVRGLGGVPFRAFPNVEVVGLAGSMDAASWVELGSCCPKVKIAYVPSAHSTWPSFPSAATGPERVAALKGLARLRSLNTLAFNISHKLEVAAFANAMQQVTGLRRLGVVLCSDPALDWGCLLPLGKLTSVTTASFTIRVPLASKQDAQMLLAGLGHVRSVTLAVGGADVAAVEEAVQESRDMGLELPKKVVVSTSRL